MAEYDLVIRNTTIATAADVVKGDIGITGGRVVALGERLDKGRKEIDATGPDRRAGRHRRPCPFRPGHRRRLGVLRRFRERQPGGGGRRHHHHHPLRLPEPGPAAARRGQPLSQARRGQVADRLRLPRDPVRRQREDHGPGFPRPGRRRLHLVQGLHDLRRREAHRPRDARCARRRAARAGDADDPCRELRLHRLADRAARMEGHDGRQVPRHLAALRGRARGDAPRDLAGRAARRADAAGARLGQGGDARDPAGAGARPARSTARPARNTCS